jgi:hypothetical protein
MKPSRTSGDPVGEILAAQYPQGYWMHRDLGISPRYRATVWQILFLAQLGTGSAGIAALRSRAGRIQRAIGIVLQDNRDHNGALRLQQDRPSLALTGAILWAVGRLGATDSGDWRPTWAWATEEVAAGRVDGAAAVWLTRAAHVWRRWDWLATYQPWQWAGRPSPSEARLSFPVTLRPDLLTTMEMACEIGRADLIPDAAPAWLRARQLSDGCWPLDHTPGPLWCDVGEIGAANPWITARARAVLA